MNQDSKQTITMKFGGTSVGSAEAIQRVARIVQRAGDNRLHATGTEPRGVAVIASAMSGVTNELIHAARAAVKGDVPEIEAAMERLRRRHHEAIDALGLSEAECDVVRPRVDALLNEARSLCHATAVLRELTPRGLDVISGMGERLSVPLVAAAIRSRGVPAESIEATELIVTDEQHGGAGPLMDETRAKSRARLLPLLERGAVPVVTGFIGATASGTPTTLGRGGSDYSATILGACLDSDEIWIWSDVDGVLSADPRIVPNAQTIATLSYAEAAEFSYFGAKVIHPKTILPAVDQQIPLRILNSFEPENGGTRILADPPPNGHVVKGITAIKNVSEITVEGRGMLGIPGIAARVFGAVAQEQVSVLMISQSSSEQSICFIVPEDAAARTLCALEGAFQYDILRHNVERVWSQDDVAILSVVGERMKGTPGIAGRLFTALADAGINILTVAQGSSEYNISLVIAADEVPVAMQAVHATFGLGK